MVHTTRRQGRARQRILYWYRTPPGIRIGRAALDDDGITLIEQHHPGIRFDWPQILKGEEEAPESPTSAEPVDASHDARVQLGPDVLARLRARYADFMAVIARREPDPERQERLKSEAARLDPDSWVTSEQVQRALEEYEAVVASLRSVLGRRRRRRKLRSSEGDRTNAARTDESRLPNDDPNQLDDAEARGQTAQSEPASQD